MNNQDSTSSAKTNGTDQRRLLPATAGEFVSRGGKWYPAMTPKMLWTIEIVDADSGEQRMIGKQMLDTNGRPIYEPNPAAERMIKQNYPDLGYMPTADFPEPKQDRRVQELEDTVKRLEDILLGRATPSPVKVAPVPSTITREELITVAEKEAALKSSVVSPQVSSGVANSESRTTVVGSGNTII